MSLALEKYDCPLCGAKNSLTLNSDSLYVCKACGYVLGPMVVAGFKAVKSAIAAAPLSGSTDFSWRDITGRITPVFKLHQTLNKAGRRLEAEIDKAAALLSLPSVCAATAKALAGRIKRVADMETTVGALLFVACRMESIYNDDLFVKAYDAKRLRRKVVEVQRMTGVAMPPPNAKQVIYRILASVGASDVSIAKDALEVFEVLAPLIGRGKAASTIAAYLALKARGYDVSIGGLASKVWASEAVVESLLKRIKTAARRRSRGFRH
ncbi:MAG: hypothetical protein JZD41_02460 [Thermoproteus sp.]|nr:hypothetical protein [Thermoproteus sp.]